MPPRWPPLTADDVARIRDVPGPVACETSRPLLLGRQGVRTGLLQRPAGGADGRSGADNVLSLLRAQKFDLIQLQDLKPGVRLSPEAPGEMAVLDSNYVEVHHSGTGLYLVPRRKAVVPSP